VRYEILDVMQSGPKKSGPDVMRERFPETSWTLLAKAREDCLEGVRAREVFAQRYYRPVLEFLTVLLHDAEKAQELSQEFFAKVTAQEGLLEYANPEKGSFRNYLKQALRNLVMDYYRHNRNESFQTHPDQAGPTGWEVLGLARFPEAEAAFHRVWVTVTLAEALTRVRALCLKRKQDVHLQLFEARYLSEAELAPSWEELGARYGLDQKTARERAETAIRHFRFVLRRMLRNEIAVPHGAGEVTEAAIDHEIKELLSPLRD
jgi:RNA polymerase sigma factor (sigma-70 family)